MKYQVLFNPMAGNGHGEEKAKQLSAFYGSNQLCYYDITKITNYADFLKTFSPDDVIIICGGDGTLHHFVNDTDGLEINRDILFFAGGSGNDFMKDIGIENGGAPIRINKYLNDLPVAHVNGKSLRFLNDVGFGIDGYCCEVGDMMRKTTNKPINYTAIALKGLLGGFTPVNATVTVDGQTSTYKKVWMAPTMNGRYFGGGMMSAPQQDRLNRGHSVSVVVCHDLSALKTLFFFPSIFKGKHTKRKKNVSVFNAMSVKVEFDRPCALQIDGETFSGVKCYSVESPKLAAVPDKSDKDAVPVS